MHFYLSEVGLSRNNAHLYTHREGLYHYYCIDYYHDYGKDCY